MNDAEIDKLIDAFLNGELDDAGRRRLAELQETDPVVREMFDEALNVEALLYAAHNPVAVPAAQTVPLEPLRVLPSKPATHRKIVPIHTRSHAWVAVAAAAMLMIAAALYFKYRPEKPTPEVVKTIKPSTPEAPKKIEVADTVKPVPAIPAVPKIAPVAPSHEENLVIGPTKTPPDKNTSVAEITPTEPPPLKITKLDEPPKVITNEAPKKENIAATPTPRERQIAPPPPLGTESNFIAILLAHSNDVSLRDDQVAKLTQLQRQYQSGGAIAKDPELKLLKEQRKIALARGDAAAMNSLLEKIHARESALGKGALPPENPMAILDEEQSMKMRPFLDKELPAPNFAAPDQKVKLDDSKFTSPLAPPPDNGDPQHPPPPGPPGKGGKNPPPGKGPPGKRPPPGPDGRPPLGPDGLPLPPPDGDDPPPGPPGRRGPPR